MEKEKMEAEIQEIERQVEQKGPYAIDVLSVTREAHNQHGLRHGDHQRYRQYCARKVRRVRLATQVSIKARGKDNKPIPITQEVVKDVRSLYIVLFDTERSWAYAMQLKDEAASDTRKKIHMLKKLKKASQLASQLEALSENLCDERTKQDIKAYASWMKGLLLVEEKKWQEALEQLSAARSAYVKLSGTSSHAQEALANARIDEIDVSLRYCAYNISKKGGAADLSKLLEQTEKSERADSPDAFSIEWEGRSVLVKNQRVKEKLNTIKSLDAELATVLKTDKDLDVKLEAFDKVLIAYQDSISFALEDVRADEVAASKAKSVKGEEHTANLKAIHSYITYTRLQKVIERNFFLAEMSKKALEGKPSQGPAGRVTKPEELVRLYENVFQSLIEIKEIPGILENPKLVQEIDAKIALVKAHRCFYAAWAFENNLKWPEALALYNRSEEYLQESARGLPKSEAQSLQELQKSIRVHKSFTKASGLDVNQHAAPTQDISSKLLTSKASIPIDQINLQDPKIVSFPPVFEPVVCKPVVFDLADNFIEYPNISHRTKQKSGITGLISSFWGR